MKRLVTVAVICLGAGLPAPGLSLQTEESAAFNRLVQKEMRLHNVPGLAVVICSDSDDCYCRGFGYTSTKRDVPVSQQTLFPLASLSKLFTAEAVLELANKKKLMLSNSLSTYLPGTPAGWEDVTIESLLTHTSGLPSRLPEGKSWSGALQRLSMEPRSGRAGQGQSYNNLAYVILGRTVEVLVHEPLSVYLRKTIFTPLGMKSTSIPTANFPSGMSLGHVRSSTGQLTPYRNTQVWSSSRGSAGVVSCAHDMYLYARHVNCMSVNDKDWRTVRLLSGTPGSWARNGWETASGPSGAMFLKRGNVRGYSSFIARYPQRKVTVVVLANAGDLDFKSLSDELSEAEEKFSCRRAQ